MKKLMTLLTLIAVGMFTMGCGDDAKPKAGTDTSSAKDAAKDAAKDKDKDTDKDKDEDKDKDK
jgi:hypothetical protein